MQLRQDNYVFFLNNSCFKVKDWNQKFAFSSSDEKH